MSPSIKLRNLLLRRLGLRRASRPFSQDPFQRVPDPRKGRGVLESCRESCFCNLCWWRGSSFQGDAHSESAVCPDCGSIARDRFLFFCFIERTPRDSHRVLETSPRLGEAYRRAMRSWFDYRTSDLDFRAHRADIRLDLQDIRLEAASVDVLLTPHVLEHVLDTDKALSEIHRILATSGRMYLQVPVLQGRTSRPVKPEFHADKTPVEWCFGPDLTPRLRQHGFETRLLCTRDLHDRVAAGDRTWDGPTAPEFDVESILEGLRVSDLLPISEETVSRKLGFQPSYMFLTWEALKAMSCDTDPGPTTTT